MPAAGVLASIVGGTPFVPTPSAWPQDGRQVKSAAIFMRRHRKIFSLFREKIPEPPFDATDGPVAPALLSLMTVRTWFVM